MMSYMRKNIVFPLMIIILALIIYFDTFKNEFTFDDYREIVNNSMIKSQNWGQLGRAYLPGPGKIKPPGRFFSLLTYSLNYAVGRINPFGYHLVNILLNSGICLLIYLVSLDLITGKHRLSFLPALIFTCQPIHSEVVAAAVERAEILSSFCFLLALRLFLRNTSSEYSKWSPAY